MSKPKPKQNPKQNPSLIQMPMLTSSPNRNIIFAVVIFIVVVVLFLLKPILMPFIVAAFFAYLTDPLVDKLQNKYINRSLAVCIIFFVMGIFTGLLCMLILPLLAKQLVSFIHNIPEYFAFFQNNLLPYMRNLGVQVDGIPLDDVKSLLQQHWQQAGGVITDVLKTASASTLSIVAFMANILLIPVVSFYLLRDWSKFLQFIKSSLPRSLEQKTLSLTAECDEVLSAFIRGQLLVMSALAVIYAVGLSIVGLDFALLLGTLAGLASVVPYMGAIVGISSASIVAYLQFHEFMPVVYVLIVFGIGQLLEGIVLTPMLVGDKIGLHPVAVIFAIMAGGQLAGFIGVLIALPVAAILMVFIRHLHSHYKNSNLYLNAKND